MQEPSVDWIGIESGRQKFDGPVNGIHRTIHRFTQAQDNSLLRRVAIVFPRLDALPSRYESCRHVVKPGDK